MTAQNVFADLQQRAWPYTYKGQIVLAAIAGGTPSDPNVAEGWLRAKLTDRDDEEIQRLVLQTMADRGVNADEAIKLVNALKHTNGFKRDPVHGLYIEGRQLKAALKEAVSVTIASPEDKLVLTGWGNTRKYLTTYFPEHVFVEEDRLYLRDAGTGEPIHEATRMLQSFPMNARIHQTGIQYTEIVENVAVDFTVSTDNGFTRDEWGMIWLTGGKQGLGAQRSQGYGVYTVTRWDQVTGPEVTVSSRKATAKAAPAKKQAPGLPEDDTHYDS